MNKHEGEPVQVLVLTEETGKPTLKRGLIHPTVCEEIIALSANSQSNLNLAVPIDMEGMKEGVEFPVLDILVKLEPGKDRRWRIPRSTS